MRPAPTTPAAGPETRIVAGCAAASAGVETPPDERMTSGSGRPASAHAPVRRVRGTARRPARGTRPRLSSTRARTRGTPARPRATRRRARRGRRRRSSSATARSCSGSRYECSRQTATASASTSPQRVEVERLELTRRPDPPAHAVTALERHERLGPVGAGPVQVRTRLAPQVQQVLEAGVRDERRARALAFEQRVRRDRRPVREALDVRGAGRTRGCEHRLLLSRRGQHLRRSRRDRRRAARRP